MTGTLQDYFKTPIPIYAHYMGWAGASGHGLPYFDYQSDNPFIVKAHVTQMKAWGVSRVILDWYGDYAPHRQINRCAALLYKECIAQGLGFTISIDAGCLKGSANPTQDFIELVEFVGAFFPLSADEVWEFGMETLAPTINWLTVATALPGNLFIHRNASGFTTPASAGAYAWMDKTGLPYLDNFYRVATAQTGKAIYGSLFWKFDDRLLGADGKVVTPEVNVWGKKNADGTPNIMIIDSANGATFLGCVDRANAFVAAGGQLKALVLNTFNDRQEGSNFDEGIKVTAGSPGLVVSAKPLFTL